MSDPGQTHALPDRVERLRELTEFTESCRKQLNEAFETLGWSQDYRQEAMGQCPYDPGHRVPVRSMEKHKASCSLREMGYSAQEQAELYDTSVYYENSSVRCYTMDKATQHQVILQARSAAPLMRMEGVFWQGQYSGQAMDVPQNHQRAVCDLTVADRLALYDHVVGVFGRETEASCNEDLYVDLVSKLRKNDGQNEPKTHLEMMAEMRDYKRRRQSYRAKNVHITKKSYSEVIREVIGVHSEELSRQWREDQEEEKEEESTRSEHASHRRRPAERRSASSECGSRSHRSPERSQDRESKKKKKKKRERDSRSPSELHHERKRKKKKKKEEREKEK